MKSGIVVLFICLIAAGCTRSGTMQKTEAIMGTEVTITVVAGSRAEGAAAIEAGMDEIRRFDRMMSLYKEDSEISKINAAAGQHPVRVSPEIIEVVESANRVSQLTNGALDITVGPLVVLWQMRLKEGTVPSQKEIDAVRALVNYRNIVINREDSTIFLKKTGMIMDLGGAAKGFIADKVAELLKKRGVDNAIVAIAGDIKVMGRRSDGSAWRIGVQHPREKDKTITVLELSNKYISTSGDYERYKIIQKKRYHHIIDPRTGRPSEGTLSATIVCESGTIGDPLTTALFILSPETAIKTVESLGFDAILEDAAGRMFMTEGIRKMEPGKGHG